MNRLMLILLIMTVGLLSCSKKKDTVDNVLKTFTVDGLNSGYNLVFKFPKTFVSARDLDNVEHLDSTDIALQWIFYIQNENPNLYCFFDSLDTKSNIIVKAGPRIDLSNKERNLTYFTVPTIRPDRVFPPASDSLQIIYDSGKKNFREKTYYKKRYKRIPDNGAISEYYYMTTKWQSVLIIVNSTKEVDMDKYILDYSLTPKSNDAN
jgi:hypothetical protein